MDKKWNKTSISIKHNTAENKTRKRSFNNLNASATDEKISQFAQVVEALTGEKVTDIVVTHADTLTV